MTVARIAKQLDVSEAEEFQRLARLLCAHGLITAEFPVPGLLPAVRRYEHVLRNEFSRVLHYRLDVGPTCVRLTRRPAALSPHRPARTPTQRIFGRWAYTYLCLVLAALESLGEQTTISQLAEEVVRLRAGDTELPVDLTAADQRRGFVDALRWLEVRGVLEVRDGDTERFVSDRDADALYDIDRDIASRLLIATPSVLRDVQEAGDFLTEPLGYDADGTSRHARYWVTRRILTEPAIYYDELPDDERAYLRQNRSWLLRDLEQLTGCSSEARAEGIALIDTDQDPLTNASDRFPASGSVALAAMLLAERLTAATATAAAAATAATGANESESDAGSPVGRHLPVERLASEWQVIVDRYLDRFSADYRDAPAKLLDEALALLQRQQLIARPIAGLGGGSGDDVIVRPALARFAPVVTIAEPQLSLDGLA
jgi:uncharacterized protein (TIGR02678 family)